MRTPLPISARLIVGLLAAVIATPFLFGVGVFLLPTAFDWVTRLDLPIEVEPVPFDAAIWRADTSGFCEKRLAMLDDLLGRRLLIGKTRSQLAELLGEPGAKPEHVGSLDSRVQLREWDLVYTAGNRDLSSGWFDPFGIDYSYVVVRFGNDGRVVEAGEIRD